MLIRAGRLAIKVRVRSSSLNERKSFLVNALLENVDTKYLGGETDILSVANTSRSPLSSNLLLPASTGGLVTLEEYVPGFTRRGWTKREYIGKERKYRFWSPRDSSGQIGPRALPTRLNERFSEASNSHMNSHTMVALTMSYTGCSKQATPHLTTCRPEWWKWWKIKVE